MNTMAAKQTHLVQTLLGRIPEHLRPVAVREAVSSVGPSDVSETVFALDLLHSCPDDVAKTELLQRLQSSIVAGHINAALSVCDRDEESRAELLRRSVLQLHFHAACLKSDSQKCVGLPLWDIVFHTELGDDVDKHSEILNVSEDPMDEMRSLLRFAKSAISPETNEQDILLLFKVSLVLLGAAQEETCIVARDVVFTIIASSAVISEPEKTHLWECIKKLSSDHISFYNGLGYRLWLRWATSRNAQLHSWFEPAYWQLLRCGLQNGDGERRKQCLGVLRRSVIATLASETTHSTICYPDVQEASGEEIIEQYERYCTVFETILLGRYLNQVLECEPDLNLLASTQSLVKPEWLYALLTAALGPKIQDSNRKFIGVWIMRSNFQPDASQDFVMFVRDSFLPWASQGSLFTSTLRPRNGQLRCEHGERLSEYITHLLHINASDLTICASLIDALLASVVGRRSGSFAYAGVYLLQGVGRALESTSTLALNSDQLEKLAELASWPALPEVARDYVLVRCLKICAECDSRSQDVTGNERVVKAVHDWETLQSNLRQPNKSGNTYGVVGEKVGPIASWSAKPSKRDSMEALAITKCRRLRTQLLLETEIRPSEVRGMLEDVWSDLEYLEYSKTLLMDQPSVVLDPIIVKMAAASDDIASTIADIMQKLQSLSQNRAYVVSPLLCAIRNTVLAQPVSVQYVPLQDIILHFAEHLPQATVDLQLEDATVALLQSVDPTLERFNYEYYFGDRPSVGIAALLDVVRRLGREHNGIAESVRNCLLQRWTRQKNPPPTVSPWKSTLQLQIILLCCEHVIPTADTASVLRNLEDLHYILSIEPLPRYRYLLSWIIARIYLTRPEFRPRILTELCTKDHHSNPKYLASLMKIGVMLAKVEGCDANFATQLASAFVPLAASSKVVIRHEAQWQVPMLMDHARTQGWTAISDNTAFASLDGYIRSLERFDDPPLERQLDRLDPVKDHTMTNLLEGRWFGLDNTESAACGRVDFDKLAQTSAPDIPPPCIELGNPLIAITKTAKPIEGAQPPLPLNGNQELGPSKAGESRALQTKGTAYLDSAHAPQTRRNDLIVIASLVDNPYNLGGLSRVSEVFGASELHLQNQNVTSNKDFSNVAVSSHLHFSIFQLSASAVPAYLAAKRSDGWTVVGIEQTDRSVLLGSASCRLPEKVVLVMGSEKEGIPALMLAECDMLVEIPQQGVTRSLNVQTAAGIVLFEYARQHRIPPQL